MIFVTQKKSVYVDSVAGSDANDGLTQATPKATCAAGMVVLASSGRKTIRLKCGSFFREQITLPAGKRLKNYGSGERPILDPRENTTGTWTLYGAAYTYTQTVNHALSSPSVHRVWEDGVRLKRVANVATVETTPGSFYAATPSGTTGVLYIHPTGDGNPNSNGKTYSYSYRMYGINMGNGCVVDGIKTGWNGGESGSIRALARCCVIRNCDAIDGAKHHVLISEGLCENVNAYDAEPTSGVGSQVAFISYNDFSTGASAGLTFRRCTVDYVSYTSGASVGFYGHGGIGLSKVVIEDCVVKNAGYVAYGQFAVENTILSRCVSIGCPVFAKAEQTGAKFYIYRCRGLSGPANRSLKFFESTTVYAAAYIRHSESQLVDNPVLFVSASGSFVDTKFCQFIKLSGYSGYAYLGHLTSTGHNVVSNTICSTAAGTMYTKTNSLSFAGDNNIYYSQTNKSGASTDWASGGTTGWTWNAWKSNTSQDQHSVLGLPVVSTAISETAFTTFTADCPVYTSGFPVGVQPTDDAETLELLASVGYTP